MKTCSIRKSYYNGMCTDEYQYIDREGTFEATLDDSFWGNSINILAFFTLSDGRKIIASAWQKDNYLGIQDIEKGAKLLITFEKNKKGIPYLRKVERVAEENSCLMQ